MKKVLVVVDMQNDFIDGSLGTQEAQEIVSTVENKLKKEKENGTIIFATQDTHYDNYLNTLEGNKLPVLHCIKDTKGWEINKFLTPYIEKENIIEKNTFGSDRLVEKLKEINPDEIELLGLCTDICVISNALLLRAAFPNTPIIVEENCCAGVTPEKHDAAIETMRSCQIDII